MAAQQSAFEWRKEELIERLAESRWELASHLDSTARSLNVVANVRRSFRENTWKWLFGAVAAGLILARARVRVRAPSAAIPSKQGILGVLGHALLGLGQPYLLMLLQRLASAVVFRDAAPGEEEEFEWEPARLPGGRK